jgi:hypothetical protein
MFRYVSLSSGVALFALALVSPASGGVTSGGSLTPPNYYGMQPPGGGGTFVDPVFGTTIKRLSAAPSMPDNADGGTLTWVLPEYSTPALFNSNNSYFLLQHNSYFAVYNGSGAYVKDAPFDMHASTEPRWSRTDNSIVYYKRGNQLKTYNVITGAVSVVRTFSEYGAIGGRGESDICWDGDHLVLVGDNRWVFVYTLSTGQKGPAFDASAGFDSVYISADDKVTISWLQNGTGRYRGIELFDKNMSFLRQITQGGGHMDMGRDVNGEPVLIWTNANDPAPICNNGIVKVRLSDGHHTCIAGLQLDWSLAVHISASDLGWAVVSTYAPSDPDPASFWPAYTNEVFRVRLDGSVVERLAHHRSRPYNDYNWSSKASINRDGTRIVFGSNFSLQGNLGYPTEYSDAYLITLGGSSPLPPTPTVPPTPRPTPRPTPTPLPLPGGGGGVSDLSMDGKSDIVWQHTSGAVHVWFLNGITQVGGSWVYSQALPGWRAVATGDFNGDRRADLVWQHPDGRVHVWFLNGTTQIGGAWALASALPDWRVVASADFNADGKPDLVWQHTDGRVYVWFMSGTSQVGGAWVQTPEAGWRAKAAADFNGDGKADLVWQHTDGRVSLWYMYGTTLAAAAWVRSTPMAGVTLRSAGDCNGDRRPDLVWQYTDGRTVVWYMNGATATHSGVIYSLPLPDWKIAGAQ